MNGSANTLRPTSDTTTNRDELSGKLIIKAQLGDDIRKMMIHNEDLTLNELVLMMERIFAGKISNSDEITIKYLDEDGDKITLLNDSDLTVALNFHKLLRLFVLVNGQEQIQNTNATDNLTKEGSLIDAKTFRNELQQIRNSVQTILDRLQLPTNQDASKSQEKDTTTTSAAPTAAVVSNTAREFDPYKHLTQTQRSTTPDSIRSKSSLTKRTFSSEQKTFQPTSSAPPPPAVDTQQQQQQQQQYQYQPTESTDANRPPSTAFPPTQMPTPHFVPTSFADQQQKTTPFGAPPPSSYPATMPSLPNTGANQFPSAFPPVPLPNANASSPFNASSAPPLPPNAGQTSAFIGQQQMPSATTAAAPPQQGGFYGQQQNLMQQRPGLPAFNNANNAYGQPPTSTPPSSSSPATITPSYIQPTSMPAPPPTATQQQYGGYQPQPTYYNPVSQYPKAS